MKEKISYVGTISTVFLSSLCCTGPLILAGLGLGGAGFATGLAAYRPYFIVVSLISLGAAFYFTYRKPKDVCCDNGICQTNQQNQARKIMLWVTLVVALVLFAFPCLLQWNTVAAPIQTKNTVTTDTALIQVEGMSCVACNTAVEVAVGKLEGVVHVTADYQTGLTEVKYDPSNVYKHDVVGAINSLGFHAAIQEKTKSKEE